MKKPVKNLVRGDKFKLEGRWYKITEVSILGEQVQISTPSKTGRFSADFMVEVA